MEISKAGLEQTGADFDVQQVPMPDAYVTWGAPDVFYRNLEFLKQFYQGH